MHEEEEEEEEEECLAYQLWSAMISLAGILAFSLASLPALLARKWSVVWIPRNYTKSFVIIHELVHAFPIFKLYHELFRVVSRNPRYSLFPF